MKITLFLFLAIITASSCNSVVSVVENTNTNKKFGSTQAYLDFIKKKINVPNDKVIILKGDDYNSFSFDIASKKLCTYYGIVNENYFVSAEQMEMKGCGGQIEFLYNMMENNSDSISKIKKNDVPVLEKLKLNNFKNTLLFIYSYKLGGLSKNKIAGVIKNLSKKNNFDYRLISLDNYDIANR